LTVDYLIVYKALPIVSDTYFHQKNSTLAYVPEDIRMHSLNTKITFASTPLFPDVCFVSYNNCVFIVSSVVILGYNICICHLLSNKEISDMAVCRFFKMASVRHVAFLKFRNCNCRTLRSVSVRYRAKFRADRSSRCRDVAVYSIFILDF